MLQNTTPENYEFPQVNNSTVDTYLEEAISIGQDNDNESGLPYFGIELQAPTNIIMDEWLHIMDNYRLIDGLEQEAYNFINHLSLEEWSNRRTNDGKKLGKQLKKLGFSQKALDFDGSFERVSDAHYGLIFNPNYWARLGMSALANPNSWDGYAGTSCQDFRHDEADYPKFVLASTVNPFYVIQLIKLRDGEKVTDFTSYESMRNRLIARTLCDSVDGRFRYSTLYGNTKTKKILRTYLEALFESGLDLQDGLDNDGREYRIIKGLEAFNITDWIYVTYERDESVEIECPCCDGYGEVEAQGSDGRDYTITCPHCNGARYITDYIEVEYENEIETETELFPYVEGIFHDGHIYHARSPKGKAFGDWIMTVKG